VVGAAPVTVAVWPWSRACEDGDGGDTTSAGFTVKMKDEVAVLPLASVTVSVTV
jgi:hypothetical protein